MARIKLSPMSLWVVENAAFIGQTAMLAMQCRIQLHPMDTNDYTLLSFKEAGFKYLMAIKPDDIDSRWIDRETRFVRHYAPFEDHVIDMINNLHNSDSVPESKLISSRYGLLLRDILLWVYMDACEAAMDSVDELYVVDITQLRGIIQDSTYACITESDSRILIDLIRGINASPIPLTIKL